MASFQSLSGFRSTSNDSEKYGKPRHKGVKPILKKLSQSEKSSIDLDRGWDEQDGQGHRDDSWGGAASFYESGAIRTGSSKDVTFAYSEAAAGGGRRYHHSRSISGNSHVSIATSGSGSGLGIGPRTGTTFVHPFQQTPRTATPPLSMSYANSLASFAADRDYSPTITEDDDSYDIDPIASHSSLQHQYTNSSHSHSNSNPPAHSKKIGSRKPSVAIPPTPNNTQSPADPISYSHSYSQPNLASSGPNPRRPSLASQRTSSYPDNAKPPLRVSTGMRSTSTTPAQSSRLANVSSQSDLHMHLAEEAAAAATNPPTNATNTRAPTIRSIASPTSPVASMSPFSRTSFEAALPRLRAKSDLDTATRADHVREARRKLQAKQMAKEEKYARQEIKQRERADNKRAQEAEKRAAAIRKEREAARRQAEIAALAEAMPPNSKHTRKLSANSSGRPSTSRLHRPTLSEKVAAGNYDDMATRSPPAIGTEAGGARNVSFQSSKRTNTAKRKTHGAWTIFMLWLRTRLLRMSG